MTARSSSPMRQLLALVFAVLLPPFGVLVSRGRGVSFYANAALSVLAVLIFTLMFAGVGLLAYVVSIAHAVLLVLSSMVRSFGARGMA